MHLEGAEEVEEGEEGEGTGAVEDLENKVLMW